MSYKQQFKNHFTNRQFLRALVVALSLFGFALIINYYASLYTIREASDSVTDIILSNTPVYNVDDAFVYGTYVLVFSILFLIFYRLPSFPFTVEAISLFVVVRSVFITLTHIAPFPTQVAIDSDIMTRVSFGSDLFFSGHTGLPFLIALVYWDVPLVRYYFLALSGFLGTVMLLGHLHYTIDVASAFFITYAIYHVARQLFVRDLHLLEQGLQ